MFYMMKKIKLTPFIILLISLLLPNVLFSQDNRTQSFSSLFQEDEVLEARFVADFKKVFKNTDDTSTFKGLFSYKNDQGETESFKVKVRTRGKQRRIECNFMPLRMEMKKKDVKGTLFEKQTQLKVVTHCRKLNVYEQNTILEYLVYKSLNVLTDSSYRVRPMLVNYVFQGEKKVDSVQKFAFIIERTKYMAERLGMKNFKRINYHANRTNIDHMNLVDVFQYMIGNTDYSVFKLHNMKMVVDPETNRFPVAIPFDFDWSGIISAAYAKPNPMFGTKKVGDRIYRGFELDAVKLLQVFDRFNQKRDKIFELFENEPLLKKSEKRRVKGYLEEFYRIINKENAVYDFIKVSRSLEV